MPMKIKLAHDNFQKSINYADPKIYLHVQREYRFPSGKKGVSKKFLTVKNF